MAKPLNELVHPTWVEALSGEEETIATIGEFLRAETAGGRPWLPAGEHILRVFSQPLPDVRVLIVGQDPYPTPGHPIGLSFAVAPNVRPLPRSLQNIFKELAGDLGIEGPPHGDLSAWTNQGVLLLNRVLTVQAGKSGSHRGIGWEQVTDAAIKALVDRDDQPLVAILWGKDAQSLAPALPDVPIIASAHPSPMSADRGFFGSKPFSRANDFLYELGADPINWSLT
ncbi:MAG: uracil-DNA glycosylase [Candidatus Nanopelagicales bacterium]|nr:uracil-DNA glycosylase [Candidatus Nanopelagicales bacterium]